MPGLPLAAVPAAPYAAYLDFSPSAIGIPSRVSGLLEKHHNVTTVRGLLHLPKRTLLETPQVSELTLSKILQALANIGLPVAGYTRDPEYRLPEIESSSEGCLRLFRTAPEDECCFTNSKSVPSYLEDF